MPGTTRVAAMLFLCGAAACGGKSGTTVPDDDQGDGPARIELRIEGQVGTERDMTVPYVIGAGPTTRAAASTMRPTPFGCFSDINPTCLIDVPVGKTITFFAIEGEGYVAGDAMTAP